MQGDIDLTIFFSKLNSQQPLSPKELPPCRDPQENAIGQLLLLLRNNYMPAIKHKLLILETMTTIVAELVPFPEHIKHLAQFDRYAF